RGVPLQRRPRAQGPPSSRSPGRRNLRGARRSCLDDDVPTSRRRPGQHPSLLPASFNPRVRADQERKGALAEMTGKSSETKLTVEGRRALYPRALGFHLEIGGAAMETVMVGLD